MKKTLISIPVHEQPLVVENLLQNIQKFVPNSTVVLHTTADSHPSFLQEIKVIQKKMDGFVYINPTHFHTHAENEAANVTGLSTVHSSNLLYMDSLNLGFDIFAIDTSNDMFVRAGIEKVFEKYACGFTTSRTLPQDYSYQYVIKDISKFIEVKTCEKGSQEGFYLPFHVFKEVAKIIPKIGDLVKAEEMYLPTLAFNLFPELYNSNTCHYVYHNPAHSAVSREDIHKVQYGELGERYAVKRVPRRMDDPTRIYINQITKGI